MSVNLKMRIKSLFSILVFSTVLIVSTTGVSRGEMQVAKATKKSEIHTVAITGFPDITAIEVDLETQIGELLVRIGRFDLYEESIDEHQSRPTDGELEKWQNRGVEYVLYGTVRKISEKKIEVQVWLYETRNQTEHFALRYVINNSQQADLPGVIANALYKSVTGKTGVFDTQFIYVSRTGDNQDYRYGLYLSDIFGDSHIPVLEISREIFSPQFSPDGRRLVYVSGESVGEHWLVLHDLQDAERNKLYSTTGTLSDPAWSKDGSRIAFALSTGGNTDIHVSDITNGSMERLTSSDAIDLEPSWIGEKELLFTSDRSGSQQIYYLHLDRADTPTLLTLQGVRNTSPVVSANRKGFAFVHQTTAGTHIAYQEFSTGVFRILSRGSMDQSPSISPNSQFVAYSALGRGDGEIGVVEIDGSYQYFLKSDSGERFTDPAWGSW